ncbi:U3 small nucleolar RNA-associated protein 25 isoform X2 [Amborella trichopoda]|uniref:U3 small nucleolar RNA-associated protein 25 isoform X2 n=1 Tax=Amborella trichopoda TaxID=13333 RepID=UPI0009BDD58A|nr:U3 small nucleolar RNA-associated protein 25 isoform X2 [Amborella trichopoda]|eukprot:XP_020526820.1 U3 small nucleolar RNA-associated protein 25 isoform X2 [Amborella trichopoda]
MGKPSATKGVKRTRALKECDLDRRYKKHTVDENFPSDASPVFSDEEPSDKVTFEEVTNGESSRYDLLLKVIGSGTRSVADPYTIGRREEQGLSDMGEDESEFEDKSSENEHSDGGSELKSQAPDEESDLDLESDDQLENGAAECTSSFRIHLGHTLSEEEVKCLNTGKWMFEWEVPAIGMPMSKWKGTGQCFLKEKETKAGTDLKVQLYQHWMDVYANSGSQDLSSSMQGQFFSLCNSYRDILHTNKKPFYLKGSFEDSNVMDAYIIHSLNHVYRTRDLVMRSNEKLAKQMRNDEHAPDVGVDFLDQGFTRPKILILLPLRSIALRVVKRMIELTPPTRRVNVEHMDRFIEEFGSPEVENDDNQNELAHKKGSAKPQKSSKPVDFEALFSGNNDDHFRIGIKFTRKSIKLYADFYNSDMIIASPLGLITIIAEAESEKEKDVDFFSSIEVLVIDHADVVAMQFSICLAWPTLQNWTHLNSVVEHLNCIPSKQHDTDIMRVRKWYLDGHARFYRQTILLGGFVTPEMNALFHQHCVNYEGKVKVLCAYKGVLPNVLLPVRQVFERFDAPSIVDADDARFSFFVKKVFPKIKDSLQGGIMLFTSSTAEFIRVRNFLRSQNSSFCLLGEYTKPADISRARLWFFEGKRKIMLYTERVHFYHRYKIRGIKDVIFYSLPERKDFYSEILNIHGATENAFCTVLFTEFDKLKKKGTKSGGAHHDNQIKRRDDEFKANSNGCCTYG